VGNALGLIMAKTILSSPQSEIGSGAEIARAVVAARKRGHLDRIASAWGVKKCVTAEVDPYVRGPASAARGEKDQIALGNFIQIDRSPDTPLIRRCPRQLQPVQLINDHGETAAVEAVRRGLPAPPIRYSDEALGGSEDLAPQPGLAGVRIHGGRIVSRRNEKVVFNDAGGFQALRRRGPAPGLLHHSDQGCTYASADYQRVLEARGLVCSMSRRGNCYDNAVAESFFSTVKSELADRFDSFGEAKMELFDYIEVFYNQRRRHSTLGQISPAEYERRLVAAPVDAAGAVDAQTRPPLLGKPGGPGFPQRPQSSSSPVHNNQLIEGQPA